LNIEQGNGFIATLLISFLLGYLPPATAETSSPLDVSQHPASPVYESKFPRQVVPLDTRISWKNRFLGGELFNAEESLPSTGPELERLAKSSGNGMDSAKSGGSNSTGYDTTGVVQQVRASEGKVKIKHGPIDRLGMPGMTMMFRVEDANQLAGLDAGAEVAFNVDNSSGGFAITRIVAKPASFDTSGVVQQVRASEGKVKIKHGPVERLGMPGMTMMFRVEDPSQLAGLEEGSEVNFNVENTAAGFAITNLQKVGADVADAFDARGTVRSLRASQGKVKIEHGPIDKFGMPGMTMLFKVRNPEDLAMLESDMQVDFNLVNGPAGFEISRIKPVAASNPMAASNKRLCYVIGPFKNQAMALAVRGRYQERGVMTNITSSSEREYVGDMVYIDDLKTRDAALATAEALKARGISDYLILNEPGKQNVLSLGVYGQKQNVASIRTRVEALNYTVKIEARYRPQKVYWLHNEQSGTTEPLDLLAGEERASGVSQIKSNCTAGGDA